jgi:hypothetical protein
LTGLPERTVTRYPADHFHSYPGDPC